MDQFIAKLSKYNEDSKERNFFEKVLEKLGPSFIHRRLEKELKETHHELRKSMKENFELQIVMNAMLNDMEFSKTSAIGNASTLQPAVNEEPGVSVHPLFVYCIKKYLPSSPLSHELLHLGLSQEYVSKVMEKRQMSELEHRNFLRHVENNINDFCEKLIEFTGHRILPHQNWRDSFNKVIKELEAKARLLHCEEMEGQPKLQQINDHFITYCRELTDGLSVIKQLLFLYEKKLRFESDVAQYYSARCKSLALKMSVLEWKIMEATYTKDTVPALKKISEQLGSKKEKLEEELKEKTVILTEYEKLGSEFSALVEEYTNLKKSIMQQQWAIEEIKKSN